MGNETITLMVLNYCTVWVRLSCKPRNMLILLDVKFIVLQLWASCYLQQLVHWVTALDDGYRCQQLLVQQFINGTQEAIDHWQRKSRSRSDWSSTSLASLTRYTWSVSGSEAMPLTSFIPGLSPIATTNSSTPSSLHASASRWVRSSSTLERPSVIRIALLSVPVRSPAPPVNMSSQRWLRADCVLVPPPARGNVSVFKIETLSYTTKQQYSLELFCGLLFKSRLPRLRHVCWNPFNS